MGDPSNERLNLVFQALSDPTRRRMLELLQEKELSLSEIAAHFSMTLAAILKHLHVLSEAGLVDHQKMGRVRHCRLEEGPILEAAVWLSKQTKYWNTQFDLLATFLSMQTTGEDDELRSKKRTTQTTTRPSYRTAKKDYRRPKVARTRSS